MLRWHRRLASSLPHCLMTARPARAVALIILDGWGYREDRESNAILMANTPNWNRIWAHESRTLLTASGRAVGLPEGQMGNSEVGHLNLGAGRIVMQDLVRIGSAIENGSFFQNPALGQACENVNASGGTLHLLGLLGDGGVHAHDAHLMALVELAQQRGVKRVMLHAMLPVPFLVVVSALFCCCSSKIRRSNSNLSRSSLSSSCWRLTIASSMLVLLWRRSLLLQS